MTKKPKTAAFDAVMPVHSYEGDKVVFKDGRVAVGFLIEPAEMESWTLEDYESFNAALVGVLRPLPVNTGVQLTHIYYDRPYREDKTQQTYFENKMNKHFFERLVLFQKTYLFISFAPVAVKTPRTNAVNALISRAGEAVIKNPFAQLVQTLEVAETSAVEMVQGIKNMGGVAFERLTSQDVHKLYNQYFNLNFDGQPMRQEREIGNELGTLSIGEQKVNVLSMVGQGSDAYAAVRNGYGVTSPMLYPLTHVLQCPHVLTQAMMIQDTRAELSSLDTDRKLNNSLSFLATQDNELRALEVSEFTAEVRAGTKQIVGLHLSVMLWDTNDNSRRENVEKATAAFRYMFGTESVVESYLALPVFFGLLPGNIYQVPDRWLTSTSDRAACYTHWTATYKSDPVGEFLTDRFRNLVQVNLFNTALDNQNAMVIGPSGSGKSYTFGNLIVQRFEKGARQIIMDVGGTYRNVLQALNGVDFENTYFEYDPQRPIEFNPFVVPRDESKPETGYVGTYKWLYNDEKTTFHLALIAALWKGGAAALDKSERTILSRFLIEYYAYLNDSDKLNQADEEFPGMENFYRFVERYDAEMQKPVGVPLENQELDPLDGARRQYQKNLKYIDMHQFFLVLGQYITGGRYAKVLNAERDVDLSEYRLICFDLAKVQADPDLYPVVAMLITELSLDLFRKFPDSVKYIALDEAWTMLSGVLSEFIESMYRTIRKTNGSVTIITQGITEITNSKIGPAIINNSATKVILRHINPDSLAQLQAPLGLTGHEMDLIKSVRSTDALREFFIKQGGKGKVFALEASPQLDAILTSKPVERNHLNTLVKFYQQHDRKLKHDKNGRILLGPDGAPVYEEVKVQRLDYAVDQFVEDKQARKGALAK
jgi:conjugal transfer ATP-binding protein TraC